MEHILDAQNPRANLSKDVLDKEYSPSQCSNRVTATFTPGAIIADYVDIARNETMKARDQFRHDLDVKVSETSTVDIYWPENSDNDQQQFEPKYVFVYVHGGNWEAISTAEAGHMANVICPRGIVVVTVGYSLAPKAHLSLMVQEVQSAFAYVARRFSTSRIVGCGFSAGAHLLAQSMASVNWKDAYGIEPSRFHSMISLCGLLDLYLVRCSYVNDFLRLSEEEAKQLSPIHNVQSMKQFVNDKHSLNFLIAVGEFDSSEYRKLSDSYRHVVEAELGVKVKYEELQGHDHFQIDASLTNAGSALMKLIDSILQ
ncbi:kynurenine formamidase-like [Sycon ciliatum]|uniref:kynurenine formamidase-like n=1 Tax=Sycon ciliatum TaxID=27933 RepID=UPI0031F604A1